MSQDDDEPLSRSMTLLGVVIGLGLSAVAVLVLWRLSHEWSQAWRIGASVLLTAGLVSLSLLVCAIAGGIIDAIKGYFASKK
jgi:hypothetical protein